MAVVARKPIQEQFSWPVHKYEGDFVVTTEGIKPLRLSEVMEFIFHGRLTPFPKQAFQRKPYHNPFKPGWIHIGKDKQDLAEQKQTNFVRTYSTFVKYASDGYDYMTFATFNTKRRSYWDRNRKHINSTHAFVIDIDSKKWSVDLIVSYCVELCGIVPSFINETNRGYHVWFVLERDVVGPHKKDEELTKAGSFYNDLNKTLIELFSAKFPSEEGGTDHLIGGERYIRIPKKIVYFSGHKHALEAFARLRKEVSAQKARQRELIRPVAAREEKVSSRGAVMYLPFAALRDDPAYKALFSMQPQPGQRRKTAFTIALTYYALNVPYVTALSRIMSWYQGLQTKGNGHPFTEYQVKRQLDDAYSGKFGGPDPRWIFFLTGLRPTKYFTRKKEERENSTQDEWSRKFMALLAEKGGVWSVSNRQLCEELALTSRAMLDSMISELIEKGIIEKEVNGRGKYSTTVYRIVIKETKTDQTEESQKPAPLFRAGRRTAAVAMPFISRKLMTQNRIEFFKSLLGKGGGNGLLDNSVRLAGCVGEEDSS